jgi:hypothetical protein
LERRVFISIARLLNEKMVDAPLPVVEGKQNNGANTSPWDDFNQRHTVEEMADKYGWRTVGESGDKLYLNRPGAKHPKGVDATILTTTTGQRRFYVHSTSTHYDTQKCYPPFGIYLIEEHNNNVKAAIAELRRQKYGVSTERKKREQGANDAVLEDEEGVQAQFCESLIIKGGRYWWMMTKETQRGIINNEVEISNFVIKPLYHLKHPVNPKRVFEIINIHGQRATLCVSAKDIANSESFKAIVEGKGNFVASWKPFQFSAIKEEWYFSEKAAIEIGALGHLPGGNMFAWANGVFDGREFLPIDTFGIVEAGAERYFIPALSSIYEGGEVFGHERRFAHNIASKVGFSEWATLFCNAYSEGENGRVGVVFACAAMFRDIIFKTIKSFPLLFLFGPKGTGKTSYLDALLSLFGEPQKPISLEGASTPKGFNRRLAQFCNALIVFEEYRNSIPPQLIGMLKGAYDGIGYERAETSNDNRTHTTPVQSAPIVTGNELPTQNSALFSRTVTVEFSKDKFDDAEKQNHNALMDAIKGGATAATHAVLTRRADFQATFPEMFRDILKWLRKEATAEPGEQSVRLPRTTEQRSLENLALLLATFRALDGHIEFPFSFTELCETLISKLQVQVEVMAENTETAQFFRAFEVMASTRRIAEGADYKIKDGLLFFYPATCFSAFREHIRRTGGNAFDDPTLARYLKRHPAFIPPKGGSGHCIWLGGVNRKCLGFSLEKMGIELSSAIQYNAN